MSMRRLAVSAVLLLVAACGAPAAGPSAPRSPAPDAGGPGGTVLAAETVFLDAGGSAPASLGAISDRPIDVGAFQGWFRFGTADSEAIDPAPGRHYVVLTAVTDCRTPDRAELVRTGDDLNVRFLGGESDPGEQVACVRQVGPVAEFAVGADALRGVRTIAGQPPLAPDGPGELARFVALGPARVDTKAVELGGAGATELAAALGRSGSTNAADASAALAADPGSGRRRFAFVLAGCAQTGAVLIVNNQAVTAKLTGNERTRCIAPAYFLATFTIAADRVPSGAVLGG